MTALAATLVGLLLAVLLACVRPLGLYMANIFDGRPIWPLRALAPAERGIYRLCGIDAAAEMSWKQYVLCLLLFNALGALALYALPRWPKRRPPRSSRRDPGHAPAGVHQEPARQARARSPPAALPGHRDRTRIPAAYG